jgi:antitoxin component HigA of HigAB toxin-antitoxin module
MVRFPDKAQESFSSTPCHTWRVAAPHGKAIISQHFESNRVEEAKIRTVVGSGREIVEVLGKVIHRRVAAIIHFVNDM